MDREVSQRSASNSPIGALAGCIPAALLGVTFISTTFAVFVKPIAVELGWGRGQTSVPIALATWMGALSTPLAGQLMDRWGVRRVAIVAYAPLGVLLMTFYFFTGKFEVFCLVFALFGLAGGGAGVVAFGKTLASWFGERRGLALGSVSACIGLGAAINMRLAQWLISDFGWRQAYFVFGLSMSFIVWPLMIWLLREPRLDNGKTAMTNSPAAGLTFGAALRTRTFWLLAVAMSLGMLALLGVLTHMVALLTDRGVPANRAVTVLMITSLSGAVGQFGGGLLLDRFDTPRILVLYFAAALIGVVLIATGSGFPLMSAAAALLGAGIGAEYGAGSYLVSRLFGRRAFASIYGCLVPIYLTTMGLGPVFVGYTYDRTGSYANALFGLEVVLVIAIGLTCVIGPYRYAVRSP